jgi:SAM-dependent methyltransferase
MADGGFRCRCCGGTRLTGILSLGSMPLANRLLTQAELGQPEPRYALELVLCEDCSLVQITETVPPEQLFRDYPYFSSFSDTMLAHARELVGQLLLARRLRQGSLVVEIGSNDGYLLQSYKAAGVPVLGIEPAENIAKVARERRSIPTVAEFFGESLARRLRAEGHRADVIHAHNVLAHVPDLSGVVRGMELLLSDQGIAVIEVPYVKEMLDKCEFDTIYHEHLCYFSVSALERLFRRHGLKPLDAEIVPIHGGSLRLTVTKAASAEKPSDRVGALLARERHWGAADPRSYQAFERQVQVLRGSLRQVLGDLKRQGGRLAAYGASAKGSTLLNYVGVGRETLDFVADRSTVKQGRYTPGTHLPIYPPERLLEQMPGHVVLLTWNFADEILQQQAEFRRRGGRFIVPIPTVSIV